MVRLWTLPDGRVVPQVFVREDDATVADASAKLALTLPGATHEDYSNDAFEALIPNDGSSIAQWRRQGDGIVVLPAPPPPLTLEQRVAALEAKSR